MGVPPAPTDPPTKAGWEHYMQGSPISHVAGLNGPLLLAYGTGDDNCHYQVSWLIWLI